MNFISPKSALIFCIIGMVLAIFIMEQKKVCFSENLPHNFHAASAIIAFELVKDSVNFEYMMAGECPADKSGQQINSSRDQRIDYIRTLTRWDFLFITFYSGFLFFLSVLVSPGKMATIKRLSFWLIIGIALTDVGENLSAFNILSGHDTGQPQEAFINYMFTFSMAKWTLLFSLVLYLGYLTFRKSKWIQTGFSLVYGALVLWFLFLPLQKLGSFGNPTEIIILASVAILFFLTGKAMFVSSFRVAG